MIGVLPQMLDAMHSWFTPPVLFLLLNLVIGTIAFTSGLRSSHGAAAKTSPAVTEQVSEAAVSNAVAADTPDSMFKRGASFLCRLRSSKADSNGVSEETEAEEILDEAKCQTLYGNIFTTEEAEVGFAEKEEVGFAETVKAENEEVAFAEKTPVEFDVEAEPEVKLEAETEEYGGHVTKKRQSLGRSQSDTPPIGALKPPKLPSKLKKSGTVDSAFGHYVVPPPVDYHEDGGEGEGDDEVNAKADDFINNFKQQLRLQRLESIMRYKEMLNRSTK